MEEYSNPEQDQSNGPLRPLLDMLAKRFELADVLQERIDEAQLDEWNLLKDAESDIEVVYSDATFIKRDSLLGISVDRIKHSPGQESVVSKEGIRSGVDTLIDFNIHIIRPVIEPDVIVLYEDDEFINEKQNNNFFIYYEYQDERPDECYLVANDSVSTFHFESENQDLEIEQKLAEIVLDYATSPDENIDKYDEHKIFADRVISDLSKLHVSPYK